MGTYFSPLRSRSRESPPERGTLELAVCRTLGTARGEGEGRLTFSGLGNPERSVLRALLSREERGLRCVSARLRGGRWSRDSQAQGGRSLQPLAPKRKKARWGKMGSGDLGWLVVSKLDNSSLRALSREHAPEGS